MTLQASFPLSMSQVAAELGVSLPLSTGDARVRWLADDVGGDISASQLLGKTSVKIVDSGTDSQGQVGDDNIVLQDVNFGAVYPGRILIFCYGVYIPDNTPVNLHNITIGGASTVGFESGEFREENFSVGTGIFSASGVNGTSGTIRGTTSTVFPVEIAWALLSVSGIPRNPAFAPDIQEEGDLSTSFSGLINIPANGVLIAGATINNNETITLSGVTKRLEIPFDGHRFALGFNNRMGVQNNRNITASWTTNSACGMRLASWSQ